ncbi:MAG: GIY-YIG nuclease family protein [Endomicrobiia bacterium]|nr:GIY-YIG nuclease family protein [Endomicrobiia bacterium]
MYYVYILKFAKNGELYIGYTHNLRERIEQHKKGL